MDRNKKYNCFFEFTLDIVGGKWKPIILYKYKFCCKI